MILELDKDINQQSLVSLKEFLKKMNISLVAAYESKDNDTFSKETLMNKISKLNKEEIEEIKEWFYNLENQKWDSKLEKDIEEGRLDILAKQALMQYQSGNISDL